MTKTSKQYLVSYKRAASPPPMRLTTRDKQIVVAVYQYRMLSSQQIEALLFHSPKPHSKRTVCQRRLQLLFHHGFLDRLPSPIIMGEGRLPYVYVLDEQGANLIATVIDQDRANIGWQPKHNQLGTQFVNHTLAINNLRIVLDRLADMTDWQLVTWLDEADFRSAKYQAQVPYRMRGARVTRIYPDGYFKLMVTDRKQEAHFFVEVDQGTMSNSRWQDKIKAYSQFRRSGQSKIHYGTHNFRMLSVTTSQRRLDNLKRATEKAGGDHYFWFTTQVNVDIWQPQKLLGNIWLMATRDKPQALFG